MTRLAGTAEGVVSAERVAKPAKRTAADAAMLVQKRADLEEDLIALIFANGLDRLAVFPVDDDAVALNVPKRQVNRALVLADDLEEAQIAGWWVEGARATILWRVRP